jgi:catechol 2,3-dioxygenase-like lactoylglutathione lyase family enzyme
MRDPQAKPTVRLQMVNPQFVVPDVVAAAEYYRDIFGFRVLGYFLDPPVFAMVARDDVEIHFGKADDGALVAPNFTRRRMGLDAYIWVNDLDALFVELKARGAKILEAPVLRIYKCYEMVVEDNFGYRLAFSQDFSSPGN